jgi:hypothetical protein
MYTFVCNCKKMFGKVNNLIQIIDIFIMIVKI